MIIKKALIRKKKNSGPNTEFEVQDYKMNENGNYSPYGNSYKKNESGIIEDIILNKKDGVYVTINDLPNKKTFTKVSVMNNRGNDLITESSINGLTDITKVAHLKSVSNETTKDNISMMESY